MTAEYHFHAQASYRFRYLDAEGRIWEGNGPRPEENLSYAPDDFLWQTPFVPLLVVTGLAAGFGAWRIEDRIRATLARRRRRGRREVFVARPEPRFVRPALVWRGGDRWRIGRFSGGSWPGRTLLRTRYPSLSSNDGTARQIQRQDPSGGQEKTAHR